MSLAIEELHLGMRSCMVGIKTCSSSLLEGKVLLPEFFIFLFRTYPFLWTTRNLYNSTGHYSYSRIKLYVSTGPIDYTGSILDTMNKSKKMHHSIKSNFVLFFVIFWTLDVILFCLTKQRKIFFLSVVFE